MIAFVTLAGSGLGLFMLLQHGLMGFMAASTLLERFTVFRAEIFFGHDD